MRFVDTFACFLRRHTSLLDDDSKIDAIAAIFKKHVTATKKPSSSTATITSTTTTPSLTSTSKPATDSDVQDVITPGAAALKPSQTPTKSSEGKSASPVNKTIINNANEDEDDDTEGLLSPNSMNGGTGPGYTWGQTLNDVTINIDLTGVGMYPSHHRVVYP